MIKIDQTIIDPGHGNCMQAAIASLLEKKLEQVPNFIEEYINNPRSKNADPILYLWDNGYEHTTPVYNNREQLGFSLKQIAKFDGGIEGYFYASVPSSSFEGISHAVIVDTDLTVVHDPNPNKLCLNYTEDKIQYILCVNDFYINEKKIYKGINYENKNN